MLDIQNSELWLWWLWLLWLWLWLWEIKTDGGLWGEGVAARRYWITGLGYHGTMSSRGRAEVFRHRR